MTNASQPAAPGHRRRGLRLHILIGVAMIGILAAGYSFFGARASAEHSAGQSVAEVATNEPLPPVPAAAVLAPGASVSATGANPWPLDVQWSAAQLDALQAEMDQLSSRLKALATPDDPGSTTGAATQPTIDDMMRELSQMMTQLEAMNWQVNAAASRTRLAPAAPQTSGEMPGMPGTEGMGGSGGFMPGHH